MSSLATVSSLPCTTVQAGINGYEEKLLLSTKKKKKKTEQVVFLQQVYSGIQILQYKYHSSHAWFDIINCHIALQINK